LGCALRFAEKLCFSVRCILIVCGYAAASGRVSDWSKLPSLEKEGWQPLRLTGWFVFFNPKSAITDTRLRRPICEKAMLFRPLPLNRLRLRRHFTHVKSAAEPQG
jgi:hypothetical protein